MHMKAWPHLWHAGGGAAAASVRCRSAASATRRPCGGSGRGAVSAARRDAAALHHPPRRWRTSAVRLNSAQPGSRLHTSTSHLRIVRRSAHAESSEMTVSNATAAWRTTSGARHAAPPRAARLVGLQQDAQHQRLAGRRPLPPHAPRQQKNRRAQAARRCVNGRVAHTLSGARCLRERAHARSARCSGPSRAPRTRWR